MGIETCVPFAGVVCLSFVRTHVNQTQFCYNWIEKCHSNIFVCHWIEMKKLPSSILFFFCIKFSIEIFVICIILARFLLLCVQRRRLFFFNFTCTFINSIFQIILCLFKIHPTVQWLFYKAIIKKGQFLMSHFWEETFTPFIHVLMDSSVFLFVWQKVTIHL